MGTFFVGPLPLPLTPAAPAAAGVLALVALPAVLMELSLSMPADLGVVAGVCAAFAVPAAGAAELLVMVATLFLRLVAAEEAAVDEVPFLVERETVPLGPPLVGPEPRLRFLMTSVLRERGRTTPCSLRKRPQALHRGWPSGLRRQRGVVWVKQFVQVVGGPSGRVPPGEEGREGAAELKPDCRPEE